MSRRLAALKPQLNRIRAWAHEGSTDAWIAHQLETTAEAVRAFRQEHGIERGGPAPLAPITPDSVVEAMLAEEAAALEAGPEPEPAAHAEDEPESAPARATRRRAPRRAAAEADADADADADAAGGSPAAETAAAEDDSAAKPTRRRGGRGGAGRTAAPAAEATAEAASAETQADEPAATDEGDEPATGEEEPARSGRKRGRRRGRGRGSRGFEARLLSGSVLLLDPSVTADAAFQEHWQGGGPLRVEISAETIVLRRIVHADADSERSDRSHTT